MVSSSSTRITVALLVYRSPQWLQFVLEQLALARSDATYEVLVVGNDANLNVMQFVRTHQRAVLIDELDDRPGCYHCQVEVRDRPFRIQFNYVDHRNHDPHAYYMGRIYHAWNRAVMEARTEYVALVNTDMSFADYWLDELLAMRDEFPCVPTSLLIESGRVPSGLPEQVRDFGRHWSTFDRAAFLARAEQIRAGTGRRMQGGLFQPCLFKRSEFIELGGYEIQARDHALASDAKLFQRFENEKRLPHVTAVRSVVYHIQQGEMQDDIA